MPTEPVGPVEVVVVAAEVVVVRQVGEEKEEEEKMRAPGIVVSRRWDGVCCGRVHDCVSVVFSAVLTPIFKDTSITMNLNAEHL